MYVKRLRGNSLFLQTSSTTKISWWCREWPMCAVQPCCFLHCLSVRGSSSENPRAPHDEGRTIGWLQAWQPQFASPSPAGASCSMWQHMAMCCHCCTLCSRPFAASKLIKIIKNHQKFSFKNSFYKALLTPSNINSRFLNQMQLPRVIRWNLLDIIVNY